MVAEKQINEFISRLRLASGENLESVILYGSAADGEFHPDFSNINLLCVLREASFSALVAIAPALEWWTKQKHHEPLVLTHEELETSIDVFSIELLDMQQRHHVLFGADVLSGLKIPMHLHRAQLEYELRAKLILLRERLLLSANDKKQLWDLMLRSLSTFTTLFRHGLIALGAAPPKAKRETVKELAARISFDASAFLQLLDIREHKAETKQFDVTDIFSRYLAALQQVTAAVDKMLDSPESRGV
ncbi:MAG TPA: nucleotidyltransferase domain-containing protein [Terriglobales bacterium]|nr:nucleotidyltransferase domain-containing protein [Terriglobales bacterium]